MGSPFGIAYGLGAGLGAVPQAYTQGQQQGISMGMQMLNAKEQARQMQEAQDVNKVLAEKIKAPMVTEDVMGENPEYAKQTQAKREWETQYGSTGTDKSPEMDQQAIQEAMNAGVQRPEVTAPQQAKVGERQVEKKWSTPYEKMAYEMNARADRLADMGLGRAAYQLRAQADQLWQQHQEQLGQLSARHLMSMNFDKALPYLRELGYDAKSAHMDQDGNTVLEMNNGTTQVMGKDAVAMMASPAAKTGEFLQRQYQWELSDAGKRAIAEANAASRELVAKAVIQGRKDVAAEKVKSGAAGGYRQWVVETLTADNIQKGYPPDVARSMAIGTALYKHATNPNEAQKLNALVAAKRNVSSFKNPELAKRIDAEIQAAVEALSSGKEIPALSSAATQHSKGAVTMEEVDQAISDNKYPGKTKDQVITALKQKGITVLSGN